MIDKRYNVRRYITQFSNETEELIAEYDLSDFELEIFQNEFGESNPENPMFDCYQIRELNVPFLKSYIDKEPNWDFSKNSYFVEASAI